MAASAENVNTIVLTAVSNDPKAIGTAAAFSHPISLIKVDDPGDWEIAMVSCRFTTPGATPVFLSTNLVDLSRVGSELANTLFEIPTLPAGEVHVEQQGSIPLWLPYAGIRQANEVEIELSLPSGVAIPAAGTTSVTLAIRRR